MQKPALLLILMLVAVSCGGSETATPETTAATTTTQATTTTAPPPAAGREPVFAITEIVFGDDGYVAITNQGVGAGSLDGWQLCQKPKYIRLNGDLAPGETLFVTVGRSDREGQVLNSSGRYGTLDPADGEMGLYLNSSFEDPDSLVSYVEWGSTGHGRAATAGEAGVWPAGDFVDAAGASAIAANVPVPVSAADWNTG